MKNILVLSLLLAGTLAPRFLAHACGPSLETDETRFSLFNAEVTGMSSLEPFYYTERFLNTDVPDPEGLDYKRNCSEWMRYCGRGVTAGDIYTIQYDTPPDEFLYAAKTGTWDAFGENSFIRYLTGSNHKEALAYIKLAKQAEANILGPKKDPWGGNAIPAPLIDNAELASLARISCRQTSSAFLRQRLAFQALRLWYYSDDRVSDDYSPAGQHPYKDSIFQVAKKYLQGRQSVVCGWSNLYVGLSQGNDTARAYYLVRAFDESEEKKVFAYQHLSDSNLLMLQHSRYARVTDNAVMAITAIKNPGRALPEIRAILRRHPDSKYLPLLLSREVNKLEAWLWTPDILRFYPRGGWEEPGTREKQLANGATMVTNYDYFAAKNYRKDRQYLKELRALLVNLTSHASSAQRPFMALATAHLCNMERDHKTAQRYARLAAKGIRATDTAMRTQQIIEEAVADAYRPDIGSSAVKKRLGQHIRSLQALGLDFAGRNLYEEENYTTKGKSALSLFAMLLSRRYQEHGDVLTAALLFNKSGSLANEYGAGASAINFSESGNGKEDTIISYASIAYLDRNGSMRDVDALLRFIHKKEKTLFEQLLVPQRWAPDDFYRDLKGTMLFRQGRYAEAAKVFCSMDRNFWASQYEYKTYLPKTRIWSLGSLVPTMVKDTAQPYARASKLDIAKDFVALQNAVFAARTPGDKAQAAFRLASAQYQTTYWGKAWMMFSYGKSVREYDAAWREDQYRWAYFTFENIGNRYRGRYYQCRDAMVSYRYALRFAMAAHDTETAARSTLMLACCDRVAAEDRRSQADYRKGFTIWGGPQPTPYTSPLLKAFVNGYSKTSTFALASTMCPDISEYISKL